MRDRPDREPFLRLSKWHYGSFDSSAPWQKKTIVAFKLNPKREIKMLAYKAEGSAFERGKQQGAVCALLAHEWMESTLKRLMEMLGSSTSTEAIQAIQNDVERWRRQMSVIYPGGEAECCGIAAGLGMDEQTYFTAQFGMRLLGTFGQCTTVGIRDAQGHPLFSKTDDLFLSELGKNVLEISVPNKGYRHVHFHFAGTIWTVAGMNEHGLAMGMTGIPGPTLETVGLPSLCALHTILPACATVPEAIAHIWNLRINFYGFSLMLGDAEGNLALVEKTGAGTVVLPEQPGEFLAHTNHILDEFFATLNPPQKEPIQTNGLHRYRTVLRRLPSLPRSVEGLSTLLRDRSSEGPICQQGEDGLHTDFGLVCMPMQKQFIYWPGYPVSTTPQTVQLATIF